MLELMKVGWAADDSAEQARKLSANKNMPKLFGVALACQISDPKVERLTHTALDYCRENDR